MAGPQHSSAAQSGADASNVPLPRSAESWIEIASQPSSSSLSSAAEQENTTTSSRPPRRDTLQAWRGYVRRRQQQRQQEQSQPEHAISTLSPPPRQQQQQPAASPTGATSSQEEYSESEDTDSDPVLTSSNEALPPLPENILLPQPPPSAQEMEHRECFTPQPNAFSHPPSSVQRPNENAIPGSYFPSSEPSPGVNHGATHERHSYPGGARNTPSHAPHAVFSTAHQADHDAALRASLSTLFSLSSAAAARNTGKKPSETSTQRPTASATRAEPTTLRIVPESDILFADTRLTRHSSASSQDDPSEAAATRDNKDKEKDKSKRRAPTGRSNSKDRHASKKPRTGTVSTTEEVISPTLLTWVVSAGVLVFVSALSFSAGYVTGRDSTFFEGANGAGSSASGAGTIMRCGDCGNEVAKSGLGLRRWRWGGTSLQA